MTVTLRSFVAFTLPVLLTIPSVGCMSLSRGKCKSCQSGSVYPAPSYSMDSQPGGFSAPAFAPTPIPVPPANVPPAEFPDTPVPPPPTGAAARPNPIQRMQGATTTFFLNANENIRRTFHR